MSFENINKTFGAAPLNVFQSVISKINEKKLRIPPIDMSSLISTKPPMPTAEAICIALHNQSARGAFTPLIKYGPTVFERWGPILATISKLAQQGLVVYRRPLRHRGDDSREPYYVGFAQDCDSFLLSLRYAHSLKIRQSTDAQEKKIEEVYTHLYRIFAKANPMFEITDSYTMEGYDFLRLFDSVVYSPHIRELRSRKITPNTFHLPVNAPLVISRREKDIAENSDKEKQGIPNILTPSLVIPASTTCYKANSDRTIDTPELLVKQFYNNNVPSVMCIPLPYYMGVDTLVRGDVNLREIDLSNWAQRNNYSAYVIQRTNTVVEQSFIFLLAVESVYTDLTSLVENYLPDLLIPATIIKYPKESFIDLLDQMLK